MPPIAIAGVGCICALGATYTECVQALFAGKQRHGLPTRFPPHREVSQLVFEVPDSFLTPWQFSGTMPRASRMALIATDQALTHGHLDAKSSSMQRVGVCLGTNIGVTAGYGTPTATDKAFLLPQDRFAEINPTHRVADAFDLCGPQQTVTNACSAGSDAIGIAAVWIAAGYCDAVIAGGTDEVTPRVYYGFKSLFINADQPCRPFDKERKGMNLGEGAAVFLLASESFCRSRQIDPMGYLLGYGAAADAHHFTQPRPDGKGLRIAIEEALAGAALDASQIGFVNAHGTGTPDNDIVESNVIADVFPGTPFISTKGYTGHMLGAAGPVEAALTLGCLQRGRLPATAGFEVADPRMPVYPEAVQSDMKADIGLSQTLAFGGSNSVLIIGKQGCLL